MKIVSIEFKNFSSYGNKVQKIEFNNEHSELYLAVGQNGAGKSTLANVIKFLLYGKVDGINLTDLPNRINKSLWGKIVFTVRGNTVEIERGLAPNIFNVTINGTIYDQAGKLNVQDYIEREFLDIPFIVFKNVVILSINDFKSFLTMNPGDKKGIIDKLFGFSIINEMKENLRKKKKELEEDINRLNRDIGIITESIVSVNKKINDLSEYNKNKASEQIEQLKKDLLDLNENRKKQLENKTKLRDKLNKVEEAIDKRKIEFNKLNENYSFANKKLKLYENKKCPECEGDLHTEFHVEKKNQYAKTVEQFPLQIEAKKKEIESHKEIFIKIRDLEHEAVAKISNIETQMNNKKGELLELSNKEQGEEFKQLNMLIKESTQKEKGILLEKNEKQDELYFMDIMFDVLGDNGIKNLAMKTILPTLNTSISNLIKKVHLPFTIAFDDKFDAVVTSLGHPVNPKTMSTGERKKADFIIIITLIKMIKIRYPSLNIMFLDEIFSSVDADGRYTILQILGETIKEIDINTFVINHATMPSELFDKQINIEKRHGFSSMEIEKLD